MKSLIIFLLLCGQSVALGCQSKITDNQILYFKDDNVLESYKCLGFFHGRDRGFQMDYFRKAFQGRLAEVLGISYVKRDFFMRILSFYDFAKALYKGLSIESKRKLIFYSKGVNEALKKRAYKIEQWRPRT